MQVRRSLLAGLALATFLAPLGAGAQTRQSPPGTATAPPEALSIGGFVGLEFADGETGLSLRGDGEMPFRLLTPQLMLSGVGSLGWTNFGDEAGGIDFSTNLFKAVPAARFTFAVAPEFDVYGDAGAGLYYSRISSDGPGDVFDDSENGFGVTLRFAVGGFYRAAPRLRIGAELGANPYFGDVSETFVSLLVGVMYTL